MPPLANVEIPVFNRPPSYSQASMANVKGPLKPRDDIGGLQDEPLSAMPSDLSPRNAKIIGRVINIHGAFYRLQIGSVELNNVGLDEILDHVSAQQLEDYENDQFEEEAELLRIAEAEEGKRKATRLQRQKERAKTKGIRLSQELDQADESAGTSGLEVATGKHGRARPSYAHLYQKFKVRRRRRRRRRKRDPATGGLLPQRDDDDALSSSEDASAAPVRPSGSYVALPENSQGRTNRDKRTKELAPLDVAGVSFGENKKQQRRRRHPVTGVLMPLGWRYNPDGTQVSQSSSGQNAMLGDVPPALKRLSISQDHAAKRVKISHLSSSAWSSSPAVEDEDVITVSPSEKEDENASAATAPILKSPPIVSRGRLTVSPPHLQAMDLSSSPETSPERNTLTSILNPVVAQTTSGEQSADDLGDDEWVIEAILTHKLSDPRTHPPELGKMPVMLYQVKWEGFDEPTWEPIESFPDRSVVDDYYRLIAARSKGEDKPSADKGRQRHSNEVTAAVPITASPAVAKSTSTIATTRDANDESEKEDPNS